MTAPSLNQYVQGEGSVDADGLNSFEQTCDDITQLREFIGTVGMQVFVRGLATAGDGGAGIFYWIEDGTGTDDGVTIIVPNGATGLWQRLATLVGSSLTVTAGASIDLTTAASFVYVQKATGSATALNLPATPIPDAPLVIIDAKGDAASNNITINGNGKTINGAATSVISTAYGNKKLVFSSSLNAWYTW